MKIVEFKIGFFKQNNSIKTIEQMKWNKVKKNN